MPLRPASPIRKGRIGAYDVGKVRVGDAGAASTPAFAEEVAQNLRELGNLQAAHHSEECSRMAYTSNALERRRIKQTVFGKIAPGVRAAMIGREIYELGSTTIHARYCSPGSGHYKFNINPNTLLADRELWICGSSEHWYLIPMAVIRDMYEHPDAYPDRHHHRIRVVTVDPETHRIAYAAPSIHRNGMAYFCGVLPVERK